jgi:hypothetical protein
MSHFKSAIRKRRRRTFDADNVMTVATALSTQPAIDQTQREHADVRADIQRPQIDPCAVHRIVDDLVVFTVDEDFVVHDPVGKRRDVDAQPRWQCVLERP